MSEYIPQKRARIIFDNYGRYNLTEIDCVNWFNTTLVLFDSEMESVYEWIHWMRGE